MGQPQHHHPVLRIGVDSGGDPATTRREEAPGPTSTRREEARRLARGLGTRPARARRGSASSAWTTLATIQQQPGGRRRLGRRAGGDPAGGGAQDRPGRGLGSAAGAVTRGLGRRGGLGSRPARTCGGSASSTWTSAETQQQPGGRRRSGRRREAEVTRSVEELLSSPLLNGSRPELIRNRMVQIVPWPDPTVAD